jgi:hypothetical protein
MTRHGAIPAICALFAAAALLSGCGNGGNGGVGQTGQNAIYTEDPFQFLNSGSSQAAPGWSGAVASACAPVAIGGSPTSLPVPLNAPIRILFNQPVDPNSLPNATSAFIGPATGSVQIVRIIDSSGATVQSEPAVGTFSTGPVDLHAGSSLPPNIKYEVKFTPALATNPNNPCQAGFIEGSVYTVIVPSSANGGSTLTIGGLANQTVFQACFTTCPCTGTATSGPFCNGTAFTDPVTDTVPHVEITTPTSGVNAPAATLVDPAAVVDNTITLVISEPLNTASMDPDNVIVRNVATGARVPGSVVFRQTGTFAPSLIPAGHPIDLSRQSIIEYRALSPLVKGVTYEIAFSGQVKDFGGNSLQTTVASPSDKLLFTTIPATTCSPSVPITEPFDNLLNLSTPTGALVVTGGAAQSTYPIDLVGDQSDGPITVTGTTATAFNTDQTIIVGGNPVSRQGKWNVTSLTVNAGAIMRLHGIWPAHFRSTGPVTVNGTVNANAGIVNPATLGTNPAYEAGPRTGGNNNGGIPGPATISGGVGNAGGGTGGRASHNDTSTSPVGYCPVVSTLHNYFGEFGYGPSVTGVANNSPTDPFFAGGDGGRSGFFPQSFAGEQGGYGGAGGTGGTIGDVGQPRVATGCAAASIPVCPVTLPGGNGLPLGLAQPRPVTQFFIAPIAVQSAGSGGGGGGEKMETGTPPSNDEQGGGGGAGGGGVRFSSVGNFTLGNAAVIQANGATGASGATLAGHGGSGSGGQVWIQSFQAVNLTSGGAIQTIGPVRFGGTTTPGCSLQASGAGGQGLIQIENGTGTINPAFTPGSGLSTGAVYSTLPFPFSTEVAGEVLSVFYDLSNGNPDLTGVTETKNNGNVAGAVLTISYEGAFEAVTGGNPDLATLKSTATGGGLITATNVATELDGYRYVRFRVRVTYPAPPATPPPSPPSVVLPSVDAISINYTFPCP